MHFCIGMIVRHLLKAGDANGMNNCLEEERNKKAWELRGMRKEVRKLRQAANDGMVWVRGWGGVQAAWGSGVLQSWSS